MTALEKVRRWIATFPEYSILNEFQVDYTDQVPANGGIFPNGLVEVDRREDLLGNITVTNQYNFGIYCVFEKSPGDDAGATVNAGWVMSFQEWVQAQSVLGLAPRFGNTGGREVVQAQNGALYEADGEGTATYLVQLSVQFKTKFEVS